MAETATKVSEDTRLTIRQAVELAAERDLPVPGRTIRWAALHEFIPGAEKFGRDWMIPRAAFLHWLNNRPRPGRKSSRTADGKKSGKQDNRKKEENHGEENVSA